MQNGMSKYYIVRADMLPEIFSKVVEARTLLETGESETVADAAERVGISRSAFYKYKDAVTPFQDMKSGRIITFNITLKDRPGILSVLLTVFADAGANILTINQSIPINGIGMVNVSAEVGGMSASSEQLLTNIQNTSGVKKVDVLAG